MLRFTALSAAAILLVTTSLQADEKAGDSLPDQLKKAVASVEDNFNRGDVQALAACWATDGDFIGANNERIVGRESIQKAFQEFLAAHKDQKIRLSVVDSRLLAEGVALVDLIAEMLPAPDSLDGEPRSTLVFVKREGGWLIASFRETLGNVPANVKQLKELVWMVGDWADETARASGVSVRSSCDWAANGSFLIRKFAVQHQGDLTVNGTEVIGWDPRARRIHSWTFNGDGSFGESVWVRDGNQWIVKYDGVLVDGGDVAATHILTQTDANTLTVESKSRLVNGQRQADVAPVTIKRVTASAPAKPAATKPEKVLP